MDGPSLTPSPLVICLGNAVADHVFRVDDVPQPPAKARARGYALTAGGMAANAAIAARRLGGRAAFWGRLGDDANGAMLLAALAAEGVATDAVRVIPGAVSPVSAVLVDAVGERAILGYRGEHLSVDPAWLPLDALAQAGALLCDPRWHEGAVSALAAAEAANLPSVLDAERSETRILLDLVPRARHAIFSVPGLMNFAPGARPADGLRRALAEGVTEVAAVTRGEKGVLWLTRGQRTPREMPAFQVAATNTTGAGDVFHGAYALAIAEGRPVEAALRFANAAGALRARDGTTAARAETEAFLAEQG
ncbi:PfkB family carbohydrate kinase [Roseococcus suduntuyensis]|uniref:Sulfofructose kinase n=1 Tax=Roseococcus suduntuyensis TaxID=455361 RepID=A0A840ACC3_9PROT|nr:PfkB family carbohydrate kinase [Roseococcus suduntuyensis]MBB3897970.1 sulfofructose kinase [Roseococcus suduntuyensis]